MVDFNLNSDSVEITNDRDFVLLQVEFLFETVPGDVLGEPQFGTKYEDYLYRLKFSASQMQAIVESDLKTLDLCGYEPTVVVSLVDGTERDIMLVEIELIKNNSKIDKIYKIS